MRKLFILSILISFTLMTTAQTWSDTVASIENFFTRYQALNPGCQLSISRNGQVLFSKAWGMADLERNIPLTTTSIIEAGSVSKQFTAAAILLLEQQGKLSLDDDVRKYIPELPDYGTPIKLRYMMHHSSGLRDWGAIATIAGWPRTTKTYNNNDVLDIIIHQKGLNHPPNQEFAYSNSNYNLFAIIVERVSGMTLAAFTRKYIFDPAGMTHTQWRDDFKRIVPNRAIAYAKMDSGYETDMPNEDAYGNGGLLTTTEDLLKWNDYYWNGHLGNPSLLPKQLAIDNLNNGQPNEYGAGLSVNKKHGLQYIYHVGVTAGYRALFLTYPERHLSIAWLSNTSEFDKSPIGPNPIYLVEDLFIPMVNGIVASTATFSKVTLTYPDMAALTASERQSYLGDYYSDEAQAGFSIIEKEGKLVLYRAPQTSSIISPMPSGQFRTDGKAFQGDDGTLVFIREKGLVTGMKITISRAKDVYFQKTR
jgi:CubicO group peptidase (beta-lactamase class C family)